MAPNALIDRARRSEVEQRVIDAMLECVGRWGVAKTTADDVARAAGVSRATLYRAFPGGKEVVFTAVLRHETERFFATVTDRLDDAATLEDAAVIGIVEAARFVTDHEALGYLLAHEPERILPAFAFHRLDAALAVATAATAPHLRRFVADDEAAAAGAEWVIRLLLTYVLDPTPGVGLASEADVRRFVRTYVLAALLAPAPSMTTTPHQEH
jgi:AcrR family transcriptional regulator